MTTSIHTWVALACATVLSASASAAPLRADTVRHLSQTQRAAAFKAAMAEQAQARAANPSPQSQDITPPTLTKLAAAREATTTPDGQQVLVDLTVTDDWSGLEWGTLVANCLEYGDRREVAIPGTFGGRSFTGNLALQFPRDLPTCRWEVSEVFGADLNGNNFYYSGEALAGFGNLKFKVATLPSEDHVNPELRAGKVLTPVVYASRPAKGTDDHPATARVELKLADGTDSGLSGISGVRRADMFLCAPAGSCFSLTMSQPDSIPYGTREATVLVGGRVDFVEPGEYSVEVVDVEDWAGHSNHYDKSNTDFSHLFGNATKITVKR